MPYRLTIDLDRRLVILTAWGRITFAEGMAQQEQLRNDPAFNPDFDQLADFTAVTEAALTAKEAAIIAQATYFSSTSRRAIVAANPAVFGIMRLWTSHHRVARGDEHIAVFYDLPAALKWLKLETLPEQAPESSAIGR